MLFWFIPKGFFPQQDTGQIFGSSEAPTDISAPAMAARQMELVRIIMADPDVDRVYSWINSAPLNQGRLAINLKPFAERHADAGLIMARLKKNVADVPGIELHLRTRQELQVGGRSSATQFQYTLEDTELNELYEWTPKLIERLKQLPQLNDVTQRPEKRRAADDGGDRPRPRRAVRHQPATHRRHAVRRAGPTRSGDHLYPG